MQINNEVIKSWLKHIKSCYFIEQNYVLSNNWYVSDSDIKHLLDFFSKNFAISYSFDDIYDFSIDIIAQNTKTNELYFCVNTVDDYRVVFIKVLHILIVSIALFKKKDAFILITSPIIKETIKSRIENFVLQLHKYLKTNYYNFEINIYFGSTYNDEILIPLIQNISYAKENENFLQSLLLINNFNKIQTKIQAFESIDENVVELDIKKEIGLINKEFFINSFETFISYKRGNIDKEILKSSVNKNLSYDRFAMMERIFEYELEVSILNFILANSPELESKNPDILLKAKKLIHKYR